MISIRDDDLRLLANCLGGDVSLFDQVYAQCIAGSPSVDSTADAVARFVSARASRDEIDEVLQQLRGATVMSSNEAALAPQLCLTMPGWLRLDSFSSNVASTEVAMVNVILHARSSLRLAFPFIDAASRDVFKQLEYAWRRGCSVHVLCREINNIRAMDLQADFVTALLDCKDGAACRVPTYVDNVKWTFHAKVLIADEVSAYVGSANLTRASLTDQAEVGILISDASVLKGLRVWFSSLWSALARNA